MKVILDFAARFDTKLSLNPDFVIKKDGRYFLLNSILRRFVLRDYYYAGVYLGKARAGKFFPSFILLKRMAENKANSVMVDRKASWLFICGRDVFRKGILAVNGSPNKNDYALVLNEFNECLGFGMIVCNLYTIGKGTDVAVKNVSDVGDFLRRETRWSA